MNIKLLVILFISSIVYSQRNFDYKIYKGEIKNILTIKKDPLDDISMYNNVLDITTIRYKGNIMFFELDDDRKKN